MEKLNIGLVGLAILWLTLRPFYLRYKVKANKPLNLMDIPQLILFPFFFFLWFLLGISAHHLIWLFPLSFIAGRGFIETSLGLKMAIYLLAFLGNV